MLTLRKLENPERNLTNNVEQEKNMLVSIHHCWDEKYQHKHPRFLESVTHTNTCKHMHNIHKPRQEKTT